MKFAMLTAAELRLVEVLLERGVFPDPPESIVRLDIPAAARADTTRQAFPGLRARVPTVMAICRPLGSIVTHGSIAELSRILARPPGRDPITD